MKYVLTVYFEAPDDLVDTKYIGSIAGDRIEDYDSAIKVSDTHVEEVDEQVS